jgi:hypothetical protein
MCSSFKGNYGQSKVCCELGPFSKNCATEVSDSSVTVHSDVVSGTRRFLAANNNKMEEIFQGPVKETQMVEKSLTVVRSLQGIGKRKRESASASTPENERENGNRQSASESAPIDKKLGVEADDGLTVTLTKSNPEKDFSYGI